MKIVDACVRHVKVQQRGHVELLMSMCCVSDVRTSTLSLLLVGQRHELFVVSTPPGLGAGAVVAVWTRERRVAPSSCNSGREVSTRAHPVKLSELTAVGTNPRVYLLERAELPIR
eukprot:CAMPEP_0182817920 /NCGR_PEP_ID=MMETSP0006_2-20121128/11737_1 /TAXON_ID=97485 /ORGANISM="Prymnesium parvum, Strain Texoma1" /LENGTH=114 /DNA_ID=CAMNT_0024944329 /DNA_START=1030 /DNA_END=1374 /DNA_ORIENTATION=-